MMIDMSQNGASLRKEGVVYCTVHLKTVGVLANGHCKPGNRCHPESFAVFRDGCVHVIAKVSRHET